MPQAGDRKPSNRARAAGPGLTSEPQTDGEADELLLRVTLERGEQRGTGGGEEGDR